MTRQRRIIDRKYPSNRVDSGVAHHLESKQDGDDGQGNGSEGFTIHDDVWSEFILIAEYIYRFNEHAEVADVFEFFRMKDMGGQEYSPSLLKRVTREVETECGPF